MMISFLILRKHIGFDDIALDNYVNYRQQLINYSRQHRINSECIKIGYLGKKRISVTPPSTGRPSAAAQSYVMDT